MLKRNERKRKMKKIRKISLLFLTLFGLTLTCCEKNDKEYKRVNKYENVNYYIHLDTGKFTINWQNPNTGNLKTWTVYLTAFYRTENNYITNKIFYECLKKNNSYDYYLYLV